MPIKFVRRLFSPALFILLTLSSLGAAEPDQVFRGDWVLEDFISLHQQDLLLLPQADYAYPFRGITALSFRGTGIAELHIRGRRFSAFYDITAETPRGYRLEFQIKAGPAFSFHLVRDPAGGYRYIYRLPPGFPEEAPLVEGKKEEAPSSGASEEAAGEGREPVDADLAGSTDDGAGTAGQKGLLPQPLYAGTMSRNPAAVDPR